MSVEKDPNKKVGISNLKKVKATLSTTEYIPPASKLKKEEDNRSLTQISNDAPNVPKYAPEYTGNLFLGSLNNFTMAGLSAYQIAVENGFVGTEQEWIDSLVGPAGGTVVPGSKTLTYNGSKQLITVTSTSSTKTLLYNLDGTLNTVSDTNGNVLKTLVYNGDGTLDEVQVSFF